MRLLEDMADYDLYDVLAELGYGLRPAHARRPRRAPSAYKHADWLADMPPKAPRRSRRWRRQFVRAGTDGLENPHIFETQEVRTAGGLTALKAVGKPADVLRETKEGCSRHDLRS